MKKSFILAAIFAAAACMAVSASASPPTNDTISIASLDKSAGNNTNVNSIDMVGTGTTKMVLAAGTGLKPAFLHNPVRLQSTSRIGITAPDGLRKFFLRYMNDSATGDYVNHRRLLETKAGKHGGGSGGISYSLVDAKLAVDVNPVSV